jgi:RNA polymerase primary sigma factor
MIASTPKRQQLDLSHARHTPLSNDEIITLCIRVQSGDIEARDRMINSNLKFVVKVANKYRGQGVPVNDLISEGVFGLITAAERYDVNRKVKFPSYAIWWIRQAIGTAIHEQNTGIICPSYSQLSRALKVAKDRNIPHLIEASEKRIETLSRIRNPRSLDEMAEKGFDPEGDWVNPEDALHQQDAARTVEGLLSKLGERDREIVKRYYGFNGNEDSMREISEHLGVSHQRIEQRKKRLVSDMKKQLTTKAIYV